MYRNPRPTEAEYLLNQLYLIGESLDGLIKECESEDAFDALIGQVKSHIDTAREADASVEADRYGSYEDQNRLKSGEVL